MSLDLDKFVKGLHAYIGEVLAPIKKQLSDFASALEGVSVTLSNRIGDLEARSLNEETARKAMADAIDALPRPQDGHTPTPEELAPIVEAACDARLPSLVAAGLPGHDTLKAMVDEAARALPPPKDGHTPTLEELEVSIGSAVAVQLPALVEAAAPLEALRSHITEAVAALPPAKDGEPATEDQIRAVAEPLLAGALAQVPAAAAAQAERAFGQMAGTLLAQIRENLPPVPTADDVLALLDVDGIVARRVDAAVAALPVPKDGADGRSVTLDEVRGILDVALAQWELAAERRMTDFLQRAVDLIPKPRDGVDGMGFDDLVIEHDGERALSFVLRQGEREKRFDAHLAGVILDRGFWDRGREYKAGDGVTFHGCFWIAKRDTQVQPAPGDDWRRAVNKGRDARGGTDLPIRNDRPVVRLEGSEVLRTGVEE